MDLSMPHVDGWTATKRLRQQRVTRHIDCHAHRGADSAP
jgi:CheY-like chemotaxis protein